MPSKVMTVLGWTLDTRQLTIHLPHEKYVIWKRDIDKILAKEKKPVELKKLESIVGQLQHMATVIPPPKHFMSCLYGAQTRVKRTRYTRLSAQEIADLHLWLDFLKFAHKGINMNTVTPREPDTVLITDASTLQGLGGFNVATGYAWRWKPPESWNKLSINALEFFAAILAFKVEVYLNPPQPYSCSLIVTDNTAAMRWLQKSNFADNKETKFQLGWQDTWQEGC